MHSSSLQIETKMVGNLLLFKDGKERDSVISKFLVRDCKLKEENEKRPLFLIEWSQFRKLILGELRK